MSNDSNTYNLKRDAFGLKINFKSKDFEEGKSSFKADPSSMKNFDYKNPKTITLGNISEKSSHIIHTEKTKTISVLMKHNEGGWPESVKDYTEQRDVINWKRGKEKPDEFPMKVKTLIPNATGILNQNLRMDIYEDCLEDNSQALVEDNFSARIITVFKDVSPFPRKVTKVAWHAEEQNIIGCAYKLQGNHDITDKTVIPCLIWDINKPNSPIRSFETHSEVTTLSFNSKLTDLVAAGCSNGTISIFDIRQNKIICSTKLEESHHEAVTDLVWMKSRNGTEFVTTSTDGKVLWWDIRNHNTTIDPDKPLYLTHKENDIEKEYGGLKIEYNPEAGATKFLIGTEQGTIFLANKKKQDADFMNKLGFVWGRHLGPITGMQRCPAHNKYVLTVGDWTARIWPDDYRSPIFISKYHPAYLTDCLWSPYRAGIFFITRSDGWLNAYDLCYKTNDYAFSYKVSDSALTSMAISNKGDKLIVGDENGKISLLKLSKSFYTVSDNDFKKDFLGKMFEREVNREKNIEQNLKKKQAPVKDDSKKLANQEQTIKDKIKKIEEDYLPFVSRLLNDNVGDYHAIERTATVKSHKSNKENAEKNIVGGIIENEEQEDGVMMKSNEDYDGNDGQKGMEMDENEKKEEENVNNSNLNRNVSKNASRIETKEHEENNLNKSKISKQSKENLQEENENI